LNKSQI